MKKLKLLLASILCSTLMLTGCNRATGTGSHSGSSEPEVVDPSEPSEPSEPGEPSEPVVLKTALEVTADISTTLFGKVISESEDSENYTYWENTDGSYGIGVSFGSYGEEYLEVAVTSAASYLPEYCIEVVAPTVGTWSDGSNGYFALYATDDEAVEVEIGSYVYNSTLCAQFTISAAEAE